MNIDTVRSLCTEELERVAAQLHTHNELYPLDEHERADLDMVLAELDFRGAL